ncbi:MAG: penicillin-binding protein 2 [Patescibacteria group bacterium]
MNNRRDIFAIGDAHMKRVSRRYTHTAWVENSYAPNFGEHSYISSNFDVGRLRWVFIAAIAFFGILIVRTGYLQIVEGGDFRAAAEENRIRIHEIKAPRGVLYDRNGEVLAHNVPNFILTVTPADLPREAQERQRLYDTIASTTGTDVNEIELKISELDKNSYSAFSIIEHIPYETALLLQITSQSLPGIAVQADTFREYTKGEYFSNVLGYLSKISKLELETRPDYLFDDVIGKAGIEQLYESDLRGTYGKKEVEVDSLGKENSVVSEASPIPGKNIHLTLDAGLQERLGTALREVIDARHESSGGAAVAMDPRTGEILALLTYPTYDNNEFNSGIAPERYQELISNPDQPLFNRPISGEYPSGSTIKPLIALAGLAEGITTPQTSFLSTGGIQIGQWFFPDWKAGGHGQTNLAKALAESVNTYFYMVGGGDETHEGLGVDRIRNYLELFGLNNTLGVDLPGESKGFLPTKEWKEETKGERWYIGDTYHLSIGQGDLLVTPLQVATYTSAIANGGTVYRPYLVRSFTNTREGTTILVEPTILRNNFVRADHITAVQNGLREAVLSGSARRLQELPVSSAAKTGTAQFGSSEKTHSWFTAYAPYENPEIVITVIVESGGEGNDSALPVALQALNYWFTR